MTRIFGEIRFSSNGHSLLPSSWKHESLYNGPDHLEYRDPIRQSNLLNVVTPSRGKERIMSRTRVRPRGPRFVLSQVIRGMSDFRRSRRSHRSRRPSREFFLTNTRADKADRRSIEHSGTRCVVSLLWPMYGYGETFFVAPWNAETARSDLEPACRPLFP